MIAFSLYSHFEQHLNFFGNVIVFRLCFACFNDIAKNNHKHLIRSKVHWWHVNENSFGSGATGCHRRSLPTGSSLHGVTKIVWHLLPSIYNQKALTTTPRDLGRIYSHSRCLIEWQQSCLKNPGRADHLVLAGDQWAHLNTNHSILPWLNKYYWLLKLLR